MKTFILFSFPLASIYGQIIQEDYTYGEIIDSVFCLHQKSQSYAIYLPSKYSRSKAWPVILVFDPAARGRLGVSVFKSGAEQLGYIILCSNNSSNNSGEGSSVSADAMMKDISARFLYDPERTYMAGFSGGARFALRYAIQHDEIKGVIGCGAGAPSGNYKFNISGRPFCYFGIVGNRDMNLQDLILTERRMIELGIMSHLQIVEGGHSWPPEEELMLSLAWISSRCTESGDSMRQIYIDARRKQVEDLVKNERILEAADIMNGLSNEFSKFDDQGLLDSLRSEKIYKKQYKNRAAAFDKEVWHLETYMDALSMLKYSTPLRPDTIHTPGWWEREIHKLKRWENSKNIEISRLGSRLLNLIEIHCAENLWDYADYGQMDKAVFILDLWMQVTPEKLWANWNAAKLYAVLGKRKEALNRIEWIISSGKAKKEWFMSTDEFESMRSDPDFIELMNHLD